ncbi:RBBP9/YdeN family alpha/beta hydrolase [Kribbella jiaozuonensis]|uniref:Alpha/beta hydrolase n=1 Tax=Kribbella jiaozuonensis TaxID=2575441 RepID=A0A4U3LWN3_9ACTN|nr:alpha/beta hydrolase [Kribbella jiaozuonensis]TKK79246.1 alpha/beta hydrolase [Kribbella jiaozuonensis]TKK83317.1 alpha/beta hydrolase [Kribbella jiaozuonensis]
MTFVIIPGLDGSDEHHWQSRWSDEWLPDVRRIQPSSWSAPDLDDWSLAITRAVESTADDIVFVTHSLGCHALAHWLIGRVDARLRGSFLVAPPDPLAPTFPVDRLPTFAALPAVPLSVPSLLVASTDDPYCSIDAAARLADGWAAPLIALDELGHINSDSNIGSWTEGRHLLRAFVAGLGLADRS